MMIPHPDETYGGLAWADYSWRQIEKMAKENCVVLLPLGSIEQHGPMLPIGCDAFLAATWAMEGAKRARDRHGVKVLVLPPVPYGIAPHHRDFAGTVSLELEVYVHLIHNIIRETVRPGFKRIACVSGHGGNIVPAQAALKELSAQFHREGLDDVKLYMADDKNCFTESQHHYESLDQGQLTFHASAEETSYYMFMRPELVKKDGLTKPQMKVTTMPVHAGWRTAEITDSGASGDPTMATPDRGREIFKYWPDALADFLKRVSED